MGWQIGTQSVTLNPYKAIPNAGDHITDTIMTLVSTGHMVVDIICHSKPVSEVTNNKYW